MWHLRKHKKSHSTRFALMQNAESFERCKRYKKRENHAIKHQNIEINLNKLAISFKYENQTLVK